MSHILKQEIKFLPGVGPKKATILNDELDIYSFDDLLYYFPYKYVDRTKFYKINEINGNMQYVQVLGKIISFEKTGEGRKERLTAIFSDASGVLELIWFKGVKWVLKTILKNKTYVVFGRPTVFNGRINIVHPEIDEVDSNSKQITGEIQPFYITTEKLKRNYLSSKGVLTLQRNLHKAVITKIGETLPAWFVKQQRLIGLREALSNIHFPQSNELLKKAQYRLKFEELLFVQLKILSIKSNRSRKFRGHVFSRIGEYFNCFYHDYLPFEMTNAQKNVIRTIRKDVGSGEQMNRLLQGDVGSGKTVVALMCMLLAIDNGTQACMMAPTEILAAQHFKTLSEMLNGVGVRVELLTGSTKQKDRKKIHAALEDGSLQILVGTHAVIENKVNFQNLGFVVIDEQHRFGVAQRAKLWKKNSIPPHVLVMTATPIPRTLAMTVYGDLDVSVIDELPPGRKPVKTAHYFDSKRKQVYSFIKGEINKGRQVYVVFPLIEESEKLDYKNLEAGYETITKVFPDLEIGMVHGKMKAADKEEEMQRFKKHETQILVSTTVIEVGVDVPNASVMVIESAERFGLSQLHQLRGRVGRGAEQSFCVLMTSYKLSKESNIRIETMVRTNDGFEIAETDLKLRGPGDIEGTQQSGIGFNLKIANIVRDGEILQYARSVAAAIIESDSALSGDENAMFRRKLKQMKDAKFEWRNIS